MFSRGRRIITIKCAAPYARIMSAADHYPDHIMMWRCQTASYSRFIAAKSHSTTQKPITTTLRYGCPTRSQSLQDCQRVSIRRCTMERLPFLWSSHPQTCQETLPSDLKTAVHALKPPYLHGEGRAFESPRAHLFFEYWEPSPSFEKRSDFSSAICDSRAALGGGARRSSDMRL